MSNLLTIPYGDIPDGAVALEAALKHMADSGAMLVENTPIDYLDFASPISGLGGKMGMDATNKIDGEVTREWGTKIRMDVGVEKKVEEMLKSLGI